MERLKNLSHIGYVVNSIEQSTLFFTDFLNIKFHTYDFMPLRSWVLGEKIQNCHFKIAMGYFEDGINIELIQPVSGITPHLLFLKSNLDQVHHIGFKVQDYSAWRDYFVNHYGADIIFEAETEDAHFGYRRCFYAQLQEKVGLVEISEIPYKR